MFINNSLLARRNDEDDSNDAATQLAYRKWKLIDVNNNLNA
jgi:hypothetical protein